jgi:DNA-binding NtrC family response regulator
MLSLIAVFSEATLKRADPKILIVDDDPILCSILTDTIAIYLPQAEVTRAFNASEALSLVSGNDYDLIVTDNILPGTNGIDMIDEIKEQYPETKIVMMTAFNPVSLQKKLEEIGDIPLLRKPFGLAAFAEALEPDW